MSNQEKLYASKHTQILIHFILRRDENLEQEPFTDEQIHSLLNSIVLSDVINNLNDVIAALIKSANVGNLSNKDKLIILGMVENLLFDEVLELSHLVNN